MILPGVYPWRGSMLEDEPYKCATQRCCAGKLRSVSTNRFSFAVKIYACGGDVLKWVSIKSQRNKTTFVPGSIVVSIDLRCKDCTQRNAGKRK
jgi:hypothetical protein